MGQSLQFELSFKAKFFLMEGRPKGRYLRGFTYVVQLTFMSTIEKALCYNRCARWLSVLGVASIALALLKGVRLPLLMMGQLPPRQHGQHGHVTEGWCRKGKHTCFFLCADWMGRFGWLALAGLLLLLPSCISCQSVLQYHNKGYHDGFYVDPLFNAININTLAEDPAFNVSIPGPVYAQILYLANSSLGRDVIFVAIEQNQVGERGTHWKMAALQSWSAQCELHSSSCTA